MLNKSFYTIIILFLILTEYSLAKDFGVFGETFIIKEQGFLTMLKGRAASINVIEFNEKLQNYAKEKIINPTALEGISPASIDNTYFYDPTYVLLEDIRGINNEIIFTAGMKVNPLDTMNLDMKIVFLDARKVEQVEWLKDLLIRNDLDQNIVKKVILVGGSPIDLSNELGIEVFFDQFGELTKKFRITKSPVIAMQEGNKIKISEIALTKLE